MAVDLELGVDTRVTAGLHPQSVASLEDYDEDTKGHLEQVVQAFTVAYEGAGKVFDARAAAATDPTLTEAAQLIRTQDMADKVFQRAAAAFDKVSANLQSGIALIEKELTTPVQSRAVHSIAVEIRNYVRGLKAEGGSPMDFVRNAILSGDLDGASAALGAPPYLSGLTPEAQAVLLRMYHEKNNPVAAKRQRAMKAALDLVGQRSGLLFKDLEKAVGVPPHRVKALKDAKAKADKAFTL